MTARIRQYTATSPTGPRSAAQIQADHEAAVKRASESGWSTEWNKRYAVAQAFGLRLSGDTTRVAA